MILRSNHLQVFKLYFSVKSKILDKQVEELHLAENYGDKTEFEPKMSYSEVESKTRPQVGLV